MTHLKVAILFQSTPPPAIEGIIKPMKEGGYSDSGADIALALQQKNIDLITPVISPKAENDFDWVFPDSHEGIESAIKKGANTFWLNTVLHSKHPILKFTNSSLLIVGQEPKKVEIFDDKFYTNNLLRAQSLPIPSSHLLDANEDTANNFPVVLKPVRGRGSQGVVLVHNEKELREEVAKLIATKKYGAKAIAETFLPGKEITITIMPPGDYTINNKHVKKERHWSLPPVERFNHINGIAPYNGIVAVVNNSRILPNNEASVKELKEISTWCELAGEIIGARAPIRIDCRKNDAGVYQIFDLNMKPNMTGASRPHRKEQDSLTMIAAKGIGWTYQDLIFNILSQYWALDSL